MFPYFGRKDRLAKMYPDPLFPTVIEPFAGSLSWSWAKGAQDVIGIEADHRVVELWHRICDDPKSLQRPEVGTITDDLFVKLCSYSEHSLTSGPMTVTSRMVRDWDFVTERAERASKWALGCVDYRHGSYETAPDIEATWFIDPPYQFANRRGYRERAIDFAALGEWCKSLRGQVIVCEQEGADWLPFQPLCDMSSHRGAKRTEVVWLNS